MFLFIGFTDTETAIDGHFNTSHVLIHLASGTATKDILLAFQYISCSYSSIDTDENRKRYKHFNTSHVLIHQLTAVRVCGWGKISIHLMFLFIRILRIKQTVYTIISIHLMFLFIVVTSMNQTAAQHFNTSHVLIHQSWRYTILQCLNISIHLMFLLIQRFYQLFRFYYISNSLKIPAFSNFSQV